MRFRYKGKPKEDLEKAVWYMNDYMHHRDLYTEFTVKLGNVKTATGNIAGTTSPLSVTIVLSPVFLVIVVSVSVVCADCLGLVPALAWALRAIRP